MGGFVLEPPDFVPFPLTVSQIHYLVCNGYLDYAMVHLDIAEINDKNKLDGISRLISAAQLFWFALNIIARTVQHLAITTLELSTVAFVACCLCNYLAWNHKPQDIIEPIRLVPKAPLAEILVQAGPDTPYFYTPMDFAKRQPHWFGHIWAYAFRLSRHLGFHFHSRKRPIDKLWDDEFGELGIAANFCLAFVQFGFAAVHIAAWNFHFPTRIEATMWHVSTVFILGSMMATWIMLSLAYELLPRLSGRSKSIHSNQKTTLSRFGDTKPPSAALATIPLGALYILARGYIIIEDFANLREQPNSTYQSVNWNAMIPHFS
ncbi:MAG: hypothetical protein Q9227_004012 [Pyrenula ochraceoflavens]